jgi:transposase
VVRAVVVEGQTYEEAAERFAIGRASVSRWLRRQRETGNVSPDKMGGPRHGILDEDGLSVVRELVEEKPDRTIAELKVGFESKTGRTTSTSGISRALQKLGLVRKKKKVVAKERESKRVREARSEFRSKQAELEPWRLVFIDETGTSIGMTRRYGRAQAGELVEDFVPRNTGTVVTLIGALTAEGLVAAMTVEGGTTKVVFETFVEQLLVPELAEGDIVVLDNLAAHRSARACELIEEAGASVLFLPPYSPDLNPIEQAWSKMKEFLRATGARTRKTLDIAIGEAMEMVTSFDARGWFGHAGYNCVGST